MRIEENFSLKNYNTFGVDVKAKFFVEYSEQQQLLRLLDDERWSKNKFLHIGEGSNLLFMNDFSGIILHSVIHSISVVEEDEECVILRVGAGVNWDSFVSWCVDNSYYGVENLSLIPGEVGAAAVQNIGAYGVEIKDVVEYVEYVDLEERIEKVIDRTGCQYEYRNSVFKNELKGRAVITYVVIRLSKKTVFSLNYAHIKEAVLKRGGKNLKNVRQTVIEFRESKLPDPQKLGNGGSFFMNPVVSKQHFDELQQEYPTIPSYVLPKKNVKIPAAWLIEQCGLKGKRFGDVEIYHKQPLVLVNHGRATGNDIRQVAQQIQNEVFKKFSIELTPEVNYIY